ncbi:glutamate racemase [Paenibacillus sp.]|uniref:glutamate racemase n=1 Tax=Paenibacillus sp. TaxID=58172 RepID=UPI002810D09E|nr:glutamate racemase [Paenibacillus sp.]
MSIAVFDSGMGGLSVLHEARERLPGENFLYYADTLHVPYGTKPKEVVKDCVMTSIRHIMEQPERVSAIVIACNTATSIAIQDIRAAYSIPVIGMEPAVKPAVEWNRNTGRRVLVTATPLTLRESKYHELINRVDDQAIVDSLPLPGLVELCEGLRFEGEDVDAYFRKAFRGFQLEEYGTIVLGCTHFPFYRKALRALLPKHIRLVDGSRGTVNRLLEVLGRTTASEIERGDVRFVSSDGSESYVRKLETALKLYALMAKDEEARA